MKVVLLSNNICSVPTLQFLVNKHKLQAVVSNDEVNPYIMQLEQIAGSLNIPFKRFSKEQLKTDFKNLLTELQPDLVLVFAFGYKIPAVLCPIPKFGFYNVHFSLLPQYRGKMPVFWQLKNGEETGGITVHQVSPEFDAGPILMQKQVMIQPGSSHGLYWGRLSLESAAVTGSAIEKLENTGQSMLLEQNDKYVSYAPSPGVGDLQINWNAQSANEIENLVNACNPDYGGAITMFRNQVVRFLEVAPAEINNPAPSAPGTIVYADGNYGIFVACNDNKYLRVNVIQSSEGILSGFKLASLGVTAGERFV